MPANQDVPCVVYIELAGDCYPDCDVRYFDGIQWHAISGMRIPLMDEYVAYFVPLMLVDSIKERDSNNAQ